MFNLEDELLEESHSSDSDIPKRQFMPGKLSGLIIAVNPGNSDNMFCTSHDAAGFVVSYNFQALNI